MKMEVIRLGGFPLGHQILPRNPLTPSTETPKAIEEEQHLTWVMKNATFLLGSPEILTPAVTPRDINSVGSFISVAIRVLSFLSGLFSSSASTSASSTVEAPSPQEPHSPSGSLVDRIDGPPGSSDSLDIAMGTLMAFGGKYLRRTAVWLMDTLESSQAEDKASLAPGGGAYLASLSPSQLEELATSAVAAGANPLKLQEAFIKATNSGDWSDLEEEISSALGPEAVGGASIGGPSLLSGLWSGLVSSSPSKNTSSSGEEEGGPLYYVYKAQETINRIDKVLNESPNPGDPTTSTALNRFVKEFHLEKEALALQTQMNTVIKGVNSLLGEDETPSSPPPPSSVSQTYTLFGYTIPDPLKALFDSPSDDATSSSGINKEEDGSSGSTATPPGGNGALSPLFLGGFGVLAALGTLAVGTYVSSSNTASNKKDYPQTTKDKTPFNSINKVDYASLNYEYLPETSVEYLSNDPDDYYGEYSYYGHSH